MLLLIVHNGILKHVPWVGCLKISVINKLDCPYGEVEKEKKKKNHSLGFSDLPPFHHARSPPPPSNPRPETWSTRQQQQPGEVFPQAPEAHVSFSTSA